MKCNHLRWPVKKNRCAYGDPPPGSRHAWGKLPYRMLPMLFFTVSCLVFMMLLIAV